MKKTLAILCALALCLCSLTVFVSADEAAAPNHFQAIVNPAEVDLTEAATGGDAWKIWTDAEATVADGFITRDVPHNTWVEFKTGTVHLNNDTGAYEGDLKGITSKFDTAGKHGISFHDQESGVAFRLKTSANLATTSFTFYIKTFNPDAPSKYDLVKADFTIELAEAGGFDGWVTIPMSKFTEHLWDNQEGAPEGFFKTDCILWFMIDGSLKSTDEEPVTMSMGEVGLFGAALQGSANYPGLDAEGNPIVPEKLITLVDMDKATDLVEFDVSNDSGTSFSKLENGAIHLVMPEDDNYGWWWQNGADFYILDDETGEPVELRPGFTGEAKTYEESADNAGLAFYVDATGLGGSSNLAEPFTVTIMICEWDYREDGTLVKKAGEPYGTWYSYPANIPAGYKGWIQVPFSKLIKNAWEGSAEGNRFDGKHIDKLVFWGSVSHDDGINGAMDLKIGDVALWGEPVPEAVEPETSTPDTTKPDTSTPDTGVSTATGIASGLAIVSLAVAAAVCFRKKD